jgi:hypothetical protein
VNDNTTSMPTFEEKYMDSGSFWETADPSLVGDKRMFITCINYLGIPRLLVELNVWLSSVYFLTKSKALLKGIRLLPITDLPDYVPIPIGFTREALNAIRIQPAAYFAPAVYSADQDASCEFLTNPNWIDVCKKHFATIRWSRSPLVVRAKSPFTGVLEETETERLLFQQFVKTRVVIDWMIRQREKDPAYDFIPHTWLCVADHFTRPEANAVMNSSSDMKES